MSIFNRQYNALTVLELVENVGFLTVKVEKYAGALH